MVTLHDISMELMKPVKNLAEWNYPLTKTLDVYCSLFKTTPNKGFGEAGLVLQNSTAVYVHRIDNLWNEATSIQDAFLNQEQKEGIAKFIKKKDRKTNISFTNFETVDFAREIDKNIDIKKTNVAQENVKPKSRCFTQLEKGIAQCIPIDIYDVNGEIIGKKYDFRCNRDISMNGVLIDELTPEDFERDGDPFKRKSPATSSNCSRITKSLRNLSGTTVHDSSDRDINSDVESEGNHDDSLEEVSGLITSIDSSKNLSSSNNTDTTFDTLLSSSLDNSQNQTLNDTTNGSQSTSLNDTNSPDNTVESIVLSNTSNNSDAKSTSDSNIEVNDDEDLLDSSTKSINLQERIPSMDVKMSLDDTKKNARKTKFSRKRVRKSPLATTCKYLLRSKTTPKTLKRIAKMLRKKNLLNKFHRKSLIPEEPISSQPDKPSMFQESLGTCVKYIREYNPLQYEHVTNTELDFLGFRLHVIESCDNVDDNVTMTSTDDEMVELYSSSPESPVQSLLEEGFRPESPHFLPENIEKWHELLQPRLLEAERRATFCIRDYTSRIIQHFEENGQRKINLDNIIRRENSREVARYFLAALDLAARQNVNLNTDKDLQHNIEVSLYEEDPARRIPRTSV